MQVRIKYLVSGEMKAREVNLAPEDYFDPLGEGELSWTIKSAPKYQDAYEYIGHAAADLCWTVLELLEGNEFWRVRTQLLDGASSMMMHSQDSDGSEEIIVQTEMLPGCWHTIRTLKPVGRSWAVVMNHMTPVGSDLALADREYCGRRSFEEMKGFADV